MQYEIRIWKDAKKMPDIEPQKAAGRLTAMVNGMSDKVNKIARAAGGGNFTGQEANPDIMIDKTGGGDDVIKSVDISYITTDVDEIQPAFQQRRRNMAQNDNPVDPPMNNVFAIVGKKKVRVIKMHIKGNLYLPLKQDPLNEALNANAISMAGQKRDENKIRNTLLLSQWASVRPEDDAREHFYRGVVVSVLTKAGDFRVITAKKVYLDSYTEDYNEGEFGTFEMTLIETVDSNADVKVAGLGEEQQSLLDSLKKGVSTAADKAATAAAVIAGVGVVGKTVVQTVEHFTGETAATKWLKYGFDTTSSAGKIINSGTNIAKNPKDVKTWTSETQNMTKSVTDNIKDAKDKADMVVPLSALEAAYLGKIKSNPERYRDYLNMTEEKKREELKKAAGEMADGVKTTKNMEKAVTNEKEIANLEKEYLDLIKKDPEQAEKYNKATTEEKLKMLQDAKKNFDDIENKYAALIKLDPKKYDEYNKASTDKQLEMLQEAKKSVDLVNKDPAQAKKYNDATDEEKLKMLQDAKNNFDDMESKYLDEIKKDPKKFDEYQKAPIEKQLDMLNDAKKAAESSNPGTSSPSSGSGSGTSTPQSSTGSGTSSPQSNTGSGTSSTSSGTDSDNDDDDNNDDSDNDNDEGDDDKDGTPANATTPPNAPSKPSGSSSTGTANLNDKINAAAQKKNGGSNGK